MKPFLTQEHERSKELREIFKCLDKHLSVDEELQDPVIYILQREMIDSLFAENITSGKERRLVILNRLSLLDSLYSTSVNRYHGYSVVDIAEAIDELGTDDEYVATLAAWLDNLDDCDAKGLKLFCRRFGTLSQKDEVYMERWEKGSRAMSLLSKYTYYLFRQWRYKDLYPSGFPIYDTLARESYTRLLAYMGEGAKDCPKVASANNIANYFKAIKALGNALWESDEEYCRYGYKLQRFDLLDTYLWRLGKFAGASYSLLLGREDYAKVKMLEKKEQGASIEKVLPQIKDELFKIIYLHNAKVSETIKSNPKNKEHDA